MQFNISGAELAGIVTVGIIFSPVIVTGLVIAKTGKAAKRGLKKAARAAREVRNRYRQHQDVENSLETARAALNTALASDVSSQTSLYELGKNADVYPYYHTVMQLACCLFTVYEDFIGAYAQFAKAVNFTNASDPSDAEDRGTALFMQGLCAAKLNRFKDAYFLFREAERYLPAQAATLNESDDAQCKPACDDVSDADSESDDSGTPSDESSAPRIHAFYKHYATYQAAWVALLLHLYPYMASLTDVSDATAGSDDDTEASPEAASALTESSCEVAVQLFDECCKVDPTDMSATFHAGVARYFRRRPTFSELVDAVNLDDVRDAVVFFRKVPDSDVLFGPKARAMEAQCLALLGDMSSAKAMLDAACNADRTITRPLLMRDNGEADVESLLRPWPIPTELFNGTCAPHAWKEKRFARPTWCGHCMKFVTLSQNISKCFQCRVCKIRVHRECKDALGELPRCLASVSVPPFRVGTKVLVDGKREATVCTVHRDCGMVSVVYADSGSVDALYASSLRALRTANIVQNHTHTFKHNALMRPTWCDACGKFIWERKSLKCDSCSAVIHEQCVNNTPGVVVNCEFE